MNFDLGGWLWLVINFVFVAAFGVALVYGTMKYRQRSPGAKQRQEEATKSLYQREDR